MTRRLRRHAGDPERTGHGRPMEEGKGRDTEIVLRVEPHTSPPEAAGSPKDDQALLRVLTI